MKGSEDARLKSDLKRIFIEECRIEGVKAEDIGDDQYLAGSQSPYGLDSIDMLGVIVAIQRQYGVRILNDAASREILATINNLADFLQPE